MKTRKEVDELKRDWLVHPSWDLEQTEGFDEYYDELKDYRVKMEKIWADKEAARVLKKSQELGISGNVKLTKHLEMLEWRIKELEMKGDL